MSKETEYREIHSEEMQDIIGKTPSWVIRRGNIIIGCVLLLLLAGAWAIRYPDVVSAPVVISASNPPVRIVAFSDGRIIDLAARDGDAVKEDQIIAIIDNPANTKDMLYLKDIVDQLDTALDIPRTLEGISLVRNIQVGEVQSDYAALFQAVANYNFSNANSYYTTKMKELGDQIRNNAKIKSDINERAGILNDQLTLDKWKDSVNQFLMNEKIISPAEYHEIRKSYLTQKMSNSNNSSSILQNDLQQEEYLKTISDIRQQYRTEQKDVLSAVREAVKKIKGLVAGWERQFVLRAPLNGKLTFFSVWNINQYVRSGEPVFMIVPFARHLVIRAQLPVYKAGKIKTGQKVLIKLREYPFEEFGMLVANVQRMSNVSLDSSYVVQLELVNGLRTTRNKTLDSRPEITGTADIITNDKSILQRIFETLYGKVNER